jgi:peptidoglycan hydrolase-like protein with peptidoglycan-binding domain
MKRIALLTCMALAPAAVLAANDFTALHPEAAIPDPTEQVAPGDYSGLISRVQERLHVLGFDAGPVNGDLGWKTQAALAQFQLSLAIPAGGQLDDRTLEELGVSREGT